LFTYGCCFSSSLVERSPGSRLNASLAHTVIASDRRWLLCVKPNPGEFALSRDAPRPPLCIPKRKATRARHFNDATIAFFLNRCASKQSRGGGGGCPSALYPRQQILRISDEVTPVNFNISSASPEALQKEKKEPDNKVLGRERKRGFGSKRGRSYRSFVLPEQQSAEPQLPASLRCITGANEQHGP